MSRAARGTILAWARDEVYAAIGAAAEEVFVVSPFVSAGIAREISLRAGATDAQTLRLLTWLSPAATATGVLDPGALLELLDSKWEIHSGRNLHAKAVFVDGKWGLVGSGNLTSKGFGGEGTRGNAELGVVLSRSQVRKGLEIASRWWKEAKPIGRKEIEKCPRPSRGSGRRRSAIGPDLGQGAPVPEERPWRSHRPLAEDGL
jgi:phosphatidylserine/phosphatidylglycerophosphate/cardiolipin synthase-like enzyme